MNIDQARKEASKKVPSNYLVIDLGFKKAVLPYKDGIKLLEVLETVESYTDGYGRRPSINSITEDVFKTTLMSYQTYTQIKMAQLLDMNLSDLQDIEAGKTTLEGCQERVAEPA